jgi:hypothetical protein
MSAGGGGRWAQERRVNAATIKAAAVSLLSIFSLLSVPGFDGLDINQSAGGEQLIRPYCAKSSRVRQKKKGAGLKPVPLVFGYL